ncbi:RNA polymerase sigma factor [Pedobacter ureilyticus]|uniref:RNA polymerase sigma factor n=1 Tax=Pedobacter ureilyticus TaxID=1393051 RepID=A0ABW9JCT6_9SPHI|nr:RNA polymerase sigma-70 factor [Pedobacter helvus]
MSTSQTPDIELLSLLQKENQAAYTEIFNRYFQLMFVFAYKKLRDEEIAKDLVQELFVKLWERRAVISVKGNLTPYLYTAMRNMILDYFAPQKVENRYVVFLTGYMANGRSMDSDALIREKQLKEYIEKQIQALPAKMRRIFEMSRKGHLSHREIAIALETSENNVSTQIMNAIRILKTKLSMILAFVLSSYLWN